MLSIACCFCLPAGPAKEALQPYVAFHAALRSAHINFVAKLEAQARSLLQHHLDTATSEFALSMMAAMPDVVYGQQQHQQQHVSRRAAAAAAAAADDTENMPPEEAEDQQALQVGTGRCSQLGVAFILPTVLHLPVDSMFSQLG
jgi:predicted cobalt transporter CbtA